MIRMMAFWNCDRSSLNIFQNISDLKIAKDSKHSF